MPLSSLVRRLASSRIVLRASLLAGAVLDAFTAVAPDTITSRVGVSYSWDIVPLVIARAAIQGLACYDRERHDPLIIISGLSLVGAPLIAVATGHEPSPAFILGGTLGLCQLAARAIGGR